MATRRVPKSGVAALPRFRKIPALQKPTPFWTFGRDLRLPESSDVFMGLGTAEIETKPPFPSGVLNGRSLSLKSDIQIWSGRPLNAAATRPAVEQLFLTSLKPKLCVGLQVTPPVQIVAETRWCQPGQSERLRRRFWFRPIQKAATKIVRLLLLSHDIRP